MANPEHVALVRKGKEAIAEWRRANPWKRLDLSGADLRRAWLAGADLRRTKLSGANLSSADLSGSFLRSVELFGANLIEARLSQADLSRAMLMEAHLTAARLWRANLTEASLSGANVAVAMLAEANLTDTNLTLANFSGTYLRQADLSGARLGATSLSNVDLSQVIGLATVEHELPSSVGVDTLIASFRGAGNRLTPELRTFFRGAGVPKELLEALPGIVAQVKYYSCFIAYGQPDLEFAQKLYEDLGARGITCWLYDMDATPGEPTWREIGEKRRGAEKTVVLCSAKALVRDGVLKEIEEQIDEDPDKLVPVSLDDLWKEEGFRVMRASRDLKPFLMERNYADFANLGYEEALDRLLAGLRRKGG